MKHLRQYIRELLLEANEYGWNPASRDTLMLDKEGMEKSDRDNVHKYLKDMGLMEALLAEAPLTKMYMWKGKSKIAALKKIDRRIKL